MYYYYYNLCLPVRDWSGEHLTLLGIRRQDTGAFMCIATNKVPPSVSKRIRISVNCESETDLLLLL